MKDGRIEKIDDDDYGVVEKPITCPNQQLFNMIRDHSHMTSHTMGEVGFESPTKYDITWRRRVLGGRERASIRQKAKNAERR